MSISVTEFGESRNDLWIIHQQSQAPRRMKLVVVAPKSYEVRENDITVTAGVVECKNEDYAIDQTIAEMNRTMGYVALSALATCDHIDEILVAGFAVNYATNKGKYVKLNVYLKMEAQI